MAQFPGRGLLIKISDGGNPKTYLTVGGIRPTNFTVNNESVDVTNKDSNGFREFLQGAGIRSIAVSGGGIYDNGPGINKLEEAARLNTFADCQIVFPNGDSVAGNFHVASFGYAGRHDDEQSWEVTLESAGAWTYTKV